MAKIDTCSAITENFNLFLTPNYPDVRSYANIMFAENIWEGDGILEESMSWKESCYIHAGLSGIPAIHIDGADALKFLSACSINDCSNWPLHKCKHIVMCNEDGIVCHHALTIRDGENSFRTWNGPVWLMTVKEQYFKEMDVTFNFTWGFIFQIAGPKSKEVIEKVCAQDISDVKFLESRPITIPTIEEELEIVRIGMTGNLAYELRGTNELAAQVYDLVYQTGKPLGMKRLGWKTYLVNHTEGGFPQENGSFLSPISNVTVFSGSFDPEDKSARWRTPGDLDWIWMAKFNHDFIGRAAVEAEAAAPKRKLVTLEWNAEDVLDIQRSYLEEGEPYKQLTIPTAPEPLCGGHADRVLKDGKLVGVSSMVAYSYYYRKFISHCSINIDQAELGSEVIIEWGDYGGRIKQVRAAVARYPYLDLPRNNK